MSNSSDEIKKRADAIYDFLSEGDLTGICLIWDPHMKAWRTTAQGSGEKLRAGIETLLGALAGDYKEHPSEAGTGVIEHVRVVNPEDTGEVN